MTREEIAKWIPLLQDFSDGAKLQLKSSNGEWVDCEEVLDEFNISYFSNCEPYINIRIKPHDNSKCVHNLMGGCPRAYVEFGTPCEHEETKDSFCKYYREMRFD